MRGERVREEETGTRNETENKAEQWHKDEENHHTKPSQTDGRGAGYHF